MTMFGNAQGLSPGNLGMKLFKPSAAAALWWDPLNEGLPVVGAYRAIATVGSPWPLAPANYAESLQNWSNPGVNDLVQVSGLPAPVPWALNTGWQFVAANTDALDTGLIPAVNWTMLVQFANYTSINLYICGNHIVAPVSLYALYNTNVNSVYYNQGNLTVAPPLVAGNRGIAGKEGFRNGISEGAIGGANALPIVSVYIGALNQQGVGAIQFPNVNIRALAFYNATLTAPQVALVAAAMAAL